MRSLGLRNRRLDGRLVNDAHPKPGLAGHNLIAILDSNFGDLMVIHKSSIRALTIDHPAADAFAFHGEMHTRKESILGNGKVRVLGSPHGHRFPFLNRKPLSSKAAALNFKIHLHELSFSSYPLHRIRRVLIRGGHTSRYLGCVQPSKVAHMQKLPCVRHPRKSWSPNKKPCIICLWSPMTPRPQDKT